MCTIVKLQLILNMKSLIISPTNSLCLSFLIRSCLGGLNKMGMKALPGGQYCHQVVKRFYYMLLIAWTGLGNNIIFSKTSGGASPSLWLA